MIYRLFISLAAILFSTALGAQTATNDADIRSATEALTVKYSLNADQAKQMYQVQQRKSRNMAEIAPLQNSNPDLYLAKLGNVQQGTTVNIRRILNNKDQVAIFQKTQAELRGQRNAKRKELSAQKASKQVIEAAVLAIYSE